MVWRDFVRFAAFHLVSTAAYFLVDLMTGREGSIDGPLIYAALLTTLSAIREKVNA